MFANQGNREGLWVDMFDEIIEAGYDAQPFPVLNVNSNAYQVFMSISEATSGYPLVVMLDLHNRVYVTMMDQFRAEVAIEYVRSRLAVTAHPEEFATVSVRVEPQGECSQLNVSYLPGDNVDRRELIQMVAEVTSGLDTTVRLISYESTTQRLCFNLCGPEHARATESVRKALATGYGRLVAEVGTLTRLEDQPRFEFSEVARAGLETARVFDLAAPEIGSRVVMNVGSSASPRYYLGSVTGLPMTDTTQGRQPRIEVTLDNGMIDVFQINNSGYGMLGYSSNQRRKLDRIEPRFLKSYLDPRRWIATQAQTIIGETQ